MLLGVSIAAVAVLVFFSRAIVEYIFRGARTLNRGVGAKFLKENFAPVDAEIEGEGLAVVEGSVPNDLVGAFCRIGPNPAHPPMGGYHWFDGDGMVHVCRIKDGKVSYANRWVQTTRLQHERERGEAVMLKFGDMKGRNGQLVLLIQMLRVMLGLASKPGFNNHEGGKVGTANTALVFHARKLLALHEGDLPHALRLLCSGVVETMGRIFEGEMSHPFTAHPKKDFKTGELCYIGYNMMGSPPTCTCGTLDKAGDIVREVTVSLEKPCMMHDVAITEHFFVLIETPLVFYPKAMLKDDSLPITWRPELPTRFGLLERGADNESGVRWFTLEPAIHTFHTANAWEEGNKVLLFASTYEYMDLSLNPQPRNGKVAPEDEKPPPAMALITLDLDTGDVTHTVLDPAGAEFPVVRPNLTGRKCRYTYAASVNDQVKFTGLAKYDLQAPPGKSLVASVEYGEKMYGGEAVFVPKTDGEVPEEQEDDGYLATYVCNEGKSPLESYFMLYNAKNLALVAKVKLPQRVPYGFHGLWMSEAEVQEQE